MRGARQLVASALISASRQEDDRVATGCDRPQPTGPDACKGDNSIAGSAVFVAESGADATASKVERMHRQRRGAASSVCPDWTGPVGLLQPREFGSEPRAPVETNAQAVARTETTPGCPPAVLRVRLIFPAHGRSPAPVRAPRRLAPRGAIPCRRTGLGPLRDIRVRGDRRCACQSEPWRTRVSEQRRLVARRPGHGRARRRRRPGPPGPRRLRGERCAARTAAAGG
jgi:hypothetical protein